MVVHSYAEMVSHPVIACHSICGMVIACLHTRDTRCVDVCYMLRRYLHTYIMVHMVYTLVYPHVGLCRGYVGIIPTIEDVP